MLSNVHPCYQRNVRVLSDSPTIHCDFYACFYSLFTCSVTSAPPPWSLASVMVLKILTYNVRGLISPLKHSMFWRDALKSQADIICIQDTHLLTADTHRSKPKKIPGHVSLHCRL